MVTVIVDRLAEVDMFLDIDSADKILHDDDGPDGRKVMADDADVKLETLDIARVSEVSLPLDVSTYRN